MNLVYAVARLLETGWTPVGEELERLPDGRAYPSVASIEQEFARSGLDLSIRHNNAFGCCRATWGPASESEQSDDPHGTVVGSCEREAAVYALAQLRESMAERQFETV